jgi:hypothetical protein
VLSLLKRELTEELFEGEAKLHTGLYSLKEPSEVIGP